ncbi:MAG: hypothetical protein A2X84_06175 [Desulfuromonadaceae bacterium GWC2_58_13]|nr:MAG: hypothetical protein A2X84_06175 [Desulfuromonadaceae bacterium GWC2_58_13]
MDETLLCLFKDYEVAKEVVRHMDRLNETVVKAVDEYLNESIDDDWEKMEKSLYENGCFRIAKSNWLLDDKECLACFSFESEDDEDDYDYWINQMLGYSKYPFGIVLSFNGLLRNTKAEKSVLIDSCVDLKKILIQLGFSESTSRGKSVYNFTKPIIFKKNKLVEAFENEDAKDGMSILQSIINEINDLAPLVNDIVEKHKKTKVKAKK